MPLRLLEVILPLRAREDFHEIMKNRPNQGVWQQELPDNRILIRVLLPGEATESLLDALQTRFENTEGFRVVVLGVEASVPRVKEEEREEGAEEREDHRIGRVSRQEIYASIEEGVKVTWTFVVLVALSTIVAAIGLLTDNVAVVIGAMVIAPLLGPNVALALATTLGDLGLARRALRAFAIGGSFSLALAILVGTVVRVDPSIPQLAARTDVTLAEIALALAVGVAGTLSYTTRLSSTLIGVFIAIALLPPIVALGLFVGSGHFEEATAALLLVLVNIIGINLAGVVTFFAQGVRPLSWWEANKAMRATRVAVAMWTALLASLVVILLLVKPR